MPATLHSKNYILRPIRARDRQDLFGIYGDAKTMQYGSDPVFPDISVIDEMLDSVRQLESVQLAYEWAIACKHSEKVVGTCALHSFSNSQTQCEVGCLLNSNYWRRGIMSEALATLIKHAQSIGIKTLVADIDPSNSRCQQFFLHLGFIKTSESLYFKHLHV